MHHLRSRALLGVAALLGLVALSAATTTAQYCSVCSDHTICLYSGVSDACKAGRFVNGVGADDQNTIVNEHNRLRNQVARGREARGTPGPQPSAANMQHMTWDPELAKVAQRWADQCDVQADACRNDPRFLVGQNLLFTSQSPCSSVTDDAEWTYAIQGWYNNVERFDRNAVSIFMGQPTTFFYTQLVWAKTELVGCGYTLYQQGDRCYKYYVCNYGPRGNNIGDPVYEIGSPRSHCPANSSLDSSYPGLC